MFQIQELFASRDTIDDAFKYNEMVAGACGTNNKAAVMTAGFVIYNTVGKLANARIAQLEAKLPPPLTFDPNRGFDSIQQALDLIYAQPAPMQALLAIVEANIRMGESDFAGSLVTSFDLSEVE